MVATSLNIFRFSLGCNSHNLDLDHVLHLEVLSGKGATTVANSVYVIALENSPPHPQPA